MADRKQVIVHGPLEVGESAATLGGRVLALPRMELRVLRELAAADGKPVSLHDLLEACWQERADKRNATKVWAVVSRLRAHLRGSPLTVEANRDVGYRLVQSAPREGILVVEDEVSMQRAITRVLGDVGDITIAPTLAEASARLEGARWAAIFIDIGLPDGSGLALLERVREMDEDVPVMVVSGRTDEDALKRASELGATYCAKPISPSALRTFARGALR